MKVGYPNHPRQNIYDEIRWISRNEFDFIDVFLEPDACDVSGIDPKALKKALGEARLETVGHTAWYLPIGSPMPELRKAGVEAAMKYIRVFGGIECPRVTIHAHWPPSMFTDREGIAFQTESLNNLVLQAKPLGVGIIYEPVGAGQETRENLEKIFSEVPELGFHLDIGHFNLNNRNPADFAEFFSHRLQHVHLHDNDGNRDLHLPMGAGKIDWNPLIKRLKAVYDSTITLEVFSKDRDYALLTKKKFLEKWRNA